MTRPKRIVIITAIAGVLLVAVGFLVLAECRPSMPGEWSRVRSGMSRQDVLAFFTDEVVDMRNLKGFDATTRDATMLGSLGYWQLLITYDASGRVATAEARFIHRSCGLLSTKPKSVL